MLFEVVNKPLVSTMVVFTEMCLLWLSDLIVGRRDSRKASRGVANYSPVSDKREGEGSFRRDEMTSNHFLAEKSGCTAAAVTGERRRDTGSRA